MFWGIPDPLVEGTNPRIRIRFRIHTKMSRIPQRCLFYIIFVLMVKDFYLHVFNKVTMTPTLNMKGCRHQALGRFFLEAAALL